MGALALSLAMGARAAVAEDGAATPPDQGAADEPDPPADAEQAQAREQAQDQTQRFTFDTLIQTARQLASQPYDPPDNTLPPALANLTYTQQREIEFAPGRTLFPPPEDPADAPAFQAQLYHRGGQTPNHVAIYRVDPDTQKATPVPYDPAMFNFRQCPVQPDNPALQGDLGFAGLKLLSPLNRPATEGYDELVSFLGSSYFRALGKGQVYGTSARGIAIDPGLPDTPEQFPDFTRLYITQPRPGDRSAVVHALLQGQIVTGAYRFEITPGDTTTLAVQARLFFRGEPRVLGLAPLSSMYFYGENDPNPKDFRPEVHDSDGLLVRDRDGGDTWRPLTSPPKLMTTDIPADRLAGFGLMQRDRDFDHYQDVEAAYHHRPSVWVSFDRPPRIGKPEALDRGEGEPAAGGGRLLELPTGDEYADNIVAMWVPRHAPKAGDEARLSYHLLFTQGPAPPTDASGSGRPAHAASTRYDRTLPGQTRVVLEFTGADLPDPGPAAEADPLHPLAMDTVGIPQGQPLHADLTVTPGSAGPDAEATPPRAVTLSPIPDAHAWRLSFLMPAHPDHTVKLSARLKQGDRPVTETWSATWPPNTP